MFNLLAIGDPVIDTHVQIDSSSEDCELTEKKETLLCFKYGEKIPIVDSFQLLGGNAPNVAIGAVKLGLKTALVSAVGNDPYGHFAIEQLQKNKVDTEFTSFDKKSKTRYSIVLNYQAERTILSYSEKKKYLWPKNLPEVNWVYYTGLSEGFEPIQKHLIHYLKKNKKVKLAVNPGSYLLKYALPKIHELLKFTHLLIVNVEEAERILGISSKNKQKTSVLLTKLLDLGIEEVVITDGINGSYAGTNTEKWRLPSFPIEVVAKTGAGDAFSSAYIAAKFYGHHIKTALLWGTANSTSVIQKHGPHHGLLHKQAIRKFLNEFGHIEPKEIQI